MNDQDEKKIERKEFLNRSLKAGISIALTGTIGYLLYDHHGPKPGVEEEDLVALKDFSVEKLLGEAWGGFGGERWDEWGKVRMRLSTPEIAAYYTRNGLKYIEERKDGKNYVQTPYETLLTGGGDCEDFAILIVEALEYAGYVARLFTVDIVTKEGEIIGAHTVAAYWEEGKYYFIQGFDGKYLTGEVKGPFDLPVDMAYFISGSIGGVPLRYYVDTIGQYIEAYKKNER